MKTNFEFQELPKEHRSLNNDDHDKLIDKIYTNFTFFYFNNNDHKAEKDNKNMVDQYLSTNLKNAKFITFSYFNSSQIKKSDDDSNKSSNILSNIVICAEKKCLILESIPKKSIDDFLIMQKVKFINITKPFNESIQNNNDLQAIDEIQSFLSKKIFKIKSNKFIKITFYPILSFIIRRHFYPSDFFEDKNFFYFNEQTYSNNQTLEGQIFNFFDDEKSNFETKFERIKSFVENKKKEEDAKNEISNKLIEFKSNDFITLRTIDNNYYSISFLVIHVESLHIFLLKKKKTNIETHEIEFCEFLSKHPNKYFTRCYGYIKEKDEINSTIYQYMSNGSLSNILKNDFVSIFANVCRILNGLLYLQKNSLVHRDLKPSNILIDHDGKAYISDFETVRLFQRSTDDSLNKDENFAESEFSSNICSFFYSPPEQIVNSAFSTSTDIYAFGEIIYFLFEKKDMYLNTSGNNADIIEMKKKNKIPKMKTKFKYIKKIYESCVISDYKKRSSIEKIQSNLYLQFNSFSFLNQYLIENNEMIQYFNEMFELILNFNIDNQLDNLINNHLFSFLFLNQFSKVHNQFDLLFILGTFFIQGKFVNKDDSKAKKCFKLSAENKNLNAFLALGDLYYNGIIVEKNRQTAEIYYNEYSNNHDSKNNPHFYFDYLYEYLNDIQLEYYLFKQHLVFSDELHNCDAFALLEYLYTEVYGVKENFFEDEENSKKITNINLINKLRESTSFLFLGHVLYYGKRNDPNYFSFKEYPENLQYFDLEKDDDQYPEFLNIKGYFYYNGILFEQSDEKAKQYYILAEKKDNSNACLNLGNVYYKNDFERSKYYFEKASKTDTNNSYAFLYLANLYYKRQTSEDYIISRNYTKKSADLNNPNAINLLGYMYYRGIGGEKDFSLAKYYYELGVKQNYAYSASNLGFFYRKGIGIQQNYLKSMQYYEIASKQFVTNALYQVGTYLFNGEGVDMNIQKAIQIFQTIIKVYDKKVSFIYLRQFYILKNSAFKLDRMAFLAYNDLGVIHIIEPEFFNKDKAKIFFAESGCSEYVHGQNNYALFYQFFVDNKENALYFYNKAASKNFALSEYNLGYLNEIDGNIDESINFYSKASEHEDEPILLYGESIFDNRLEISKTFIICMTNLKLVLYHLSKSNKVLAKSFFVQAFSQLEKKYDKLKCVFEINDQIEYKFQFNFIFDKKQNIFDYLKYFIFNYPLFNLKNQKNLDPKIFAKLNKESNHYSKNPHILSQFESLIKKSRSNVNQKDKTSIKIKELEEKFDKNFDESVFYDLGFLFDFATSSELNSKFVEEIEEIVNNMKKIIYTHPYPILFGRIWLHQNSNEKCQKIDDSFYDGFGF